MSSISKANSRRIVPSSKTFIKFQIVEGSQYFSPDLTEKDSLLVKPLKVE